MAFQETGNPEDGIWSAGPVMALIDDVPTCAELCETIIADAEDIITGRLRDMVRT